MKEAYVATYNLADEFSNLVWWDKWLRKNLKKKVKLLSKRVK